MFKTETPIIMRPQEEKVWREVRSAGLICAVEGMDDAGAEGEESQVVISDRDRSLGCVPPCAGGRGKGAESVGRRW